MNVINNYNNTISNLAILGRLPFEGNKTVTTNKDMLSNITMPLISAVTTNVENAKIYYSEKEIKKIGMTHAELVKTEYLQAVLDRYKYNGTDDMYASVGFGAISPGKIIARMLEEYRKEHQTENLEENAGRGKSRQKRGIWNAD